LWFRYGWVGVDFFFVLSGFLITGILRKTRQEPFYWRRFYIKRATRILPPLLLGITVAVLLWPSSSVIGIAGYALGLANIVDMTHFSIYPIKHLWSLSVEEHYYLLWPLAVLRLRKTQLQWVLIAIIILVPLNRLLFTYLLAPGEPNAIYFLTPFRIDGIALGSLLALLLEQRSWQERFKRWSWVGVALALAVFLALRSIVGPPVFWLYAYNPVFNSMGYFLVALVAFFVIGHARLRPDSIPTRILRNPLLTKLGVISYGLYVYSWIIMALMTHYFTGLSDRMNGLIHIFVSIPVAAVLFKYYEQPITVWGRGVAARLPAKANMATETMPQIQQGPPVLAGEVEWR
jgi:peptidoglycan/LPS O-acetylase OafA/YrhL